MQTKATIILNRLVIMSESKTAYDQYFHKGVNIIRSATNSTGKSTIMDFIFFVLGGDVDEWTDEALACDYVMAEIVFNGKFLTLKRELGNDRHPPIYMYEGSYNNALDNSLDWLRFSHRRSSDRDSFSQAIFRLLGYPENKLSSFDNITIHQLLRLVYCDQLTSVNHIFKNQTFDPEEMRLTIGEFLLGVEDLDHHGLRLQLRDKEKEFENLSGRLKATKDVLASVDLPPDIVEIQEKIKKYTNERDELRKQINYLESPTHKDRNADETEEVINIRRELTETKKNLKQYLDSREALAYEIEDSTHFINSIREKLAALNESELTRESLGELKFEFCPACLSKIVDATSLSKSICNLCNKEHSDETDTTGYLRMQFELNYQLRESEQLLVSKKLETEELNQRISESFSKRKQLQERYNSFVVTADPIAAELKDSLTRIGHFDNSLNNLKEKAKLIGVIDGISMEKSEISRSISRLMDQIDTKKRKREERWQMLRKRISAITVEILQNDFLCEESFKEATEFEFDFAKDRFLVDGRSKFSASSICYLKSAFFFALLLISIEDEQVLFPRFLLLDNIEDKGSTPERVQNMHRLIIQMLKDVEGDHQVIFTTSLLEDSLNNSKYCIGPEYNYSKKTLNL